MYVHVGVCMVVCGGQAEKAGQVEQAGRAEQAKQAARAARCPLLSPADIIQSY